MSNPGAELGSGCKLGERPNIGFINCDDEEDCIQGSGSGDGTHPGGDYGGGSRNTYSGSNDNRGTSSNPNGGTSDDSWSMGDSESKWALNPFLSLYTLNRFQVDPRTISMRTVVVLVPLFWVDFLFSF